MEALRKKEISANKASKVYKIPSSTLYKIARKEGIELAQPFNAVATAWNQDDLNTALEAIRGGIPVQKAAAEFGKDNSEPNILLYSLLLLQRHTKRNPVRKMQEGWNRTAKKWAGIFIIGSNICS